MTVKALLQFKRQLKALNHYYNFIVKENIATQDAIEIDEVHKYFLDAIEEELVWVGIEESRKE